MNDSSVPLFHLLLAVGAAAAALLVHRLRQSRSAAARVLLRDIGGDGSRHDLGAPRSAAERLRNLGIAGLVLGFSAFWIADTAPLHSGWNDLWSGVGLFLVFGGAYACWQAWIRRSPSTEILDTTRPMRPFGAPDVRRPHRPRPRR